MASRPNLASSRLHLGCGLEAPDDWLNVDGSYQASFARWPRLKSVLVGLGIYPRSQAQIDWPTNILRINLRQRLPFASNRFEAVYSSHTFEHLFRDEAQALCHECFRVLRAGGICRVLVPDLAAAVQRYLVPAKDRTGISAADAFMSEILVHPRASPRGALGLYHRLMNVHDHKWMYDGESLCRLFHEAGFKDIQVYRKKEGQMPGLKRIENASRIEGGAGVAVEGRKD